MAITISLKDYWKDCVKNEMEARMQKLKALICDRTSSRSAELKQASPCSRLLGAFIENPTAAEDAQKSTVTIDCS